MGLRARLRARRLARWRRGVRLRPGDEVRVWESDRVRTVESVLSAHGAETLFRLEGDAEGLYWPRGALRAVAVKPWLVGGLGEDGQHG